MKNLIEPPEGLLEKIMTRIDKEKRLLAVRRRIIVFSVLLASSILLANPAVKILASEAGESGFFQFFSLIFTDTGIIFTSLRYFSMALLETAPVIGFMAVLSVALVFLWALKNLFSNVKNILIINNQNYGYR